jgi:biofilm PGA synthesis N-glycosyltransferase PgaC
MMLLNVFYILALSYAIVLLLLYYYWQQLKQPSAHTPEATIQLSVIVVVRNEAQNIEALLTDLAAQTYAKCSFEVLVVNDHSTDATCEKIKALQKEGGMRLRLLQLTGEQGKKAGVELAVRQARGEVMVVTDGDCRVPQDWLKTLASTFEQEKAIFIAGPVAYTHEENLFERLQTIEFASLVGVGAAMLQAGQPAMCNAANMAFSREAYLAVNAYGSNRHIPSGDDEFLLQALFARYPQQVFFLNGPGLLVQTRAQSGWHSFYQQRKRWAGKWRLHRKASVAITAIGVFLFHVTWLCVAVAVALQLPFIYFFMGAMLKLGAEFLFLHTVLKGFGRKLQLFPFILLQLFYPFYVLFFGIAVNFGSFTWKDRTYKYAKI